MFITSFEQAAIAEEKATVWAAERCIRAARLAQNAELVENRMTIKQTKR